MVRMLTFYRNVVVPWIMRLVGMRFTTVEIEPGTVMTFWVPNTSSKGKPAVVFLHGFGVDGILTWHLQVLALARSYSLYVPDLIFFGGSSTVRTERTLSFQAECVAKGLSHLGVRQCAVVGFSYGGAVAFKLASSHPELVRFLVVSSCVISLTESTSPTELRRLGLSSWSELLLPHTVEGVKKLCDTVTNRFKILPRFFYKDLLETQLYNRKQKEELLEASIEPDSTGPAPKYRQRICLLWGEADKMVNMKMALHLKQQIGETATLDSIRAAGHCLQLDGPCTFNKKLKRMLASFFENGCEQQHKEGF